MDSEKEEMNQADILALHHFYSKHISDLPHEQALTELFAQVLTNVERHETCSTAAPAGSQTVEVHVTVQCAL